MPSFPGRLLRLRPDPTATHAAQIVHVPMAPVVALVVGVATAQRIVVMAVSPTAMPRRIAVNMLPRRARRVL